MVVKYTVEIGKVGAKRSNFGMAQNWQVLYYCSSVASASAHLSRVLGVAMCMSWSWKRIAKAVMCTATDSCQLAYILPNE